MLVVIVMVVILCLVSLIDDHCRNAVVVSLTVSHCNESIRWVQLKQVLMKVSDISNEARPMQVAEPWIDCLLMEFFNQV